MKKIVIALGIIVLIAAALPIIGNSYMQGTIDTRVQEFESYGLKSKNTQTDSSYLSTKKHFEFVLENADNFIAYLNQYADQQVSPYANAMLKGMVVGADLEYSNLPFSKDMILDIYPLSMSPEMAENLQKQDMNFYTYLKKFLQEKGILYHINYQILSEDFKGYVKDINEKYLLHDGTEFELFLKDTTFEGNGKLIAPNRLTSKLKELHLYINQSKENVLFNLKNLQTSTSYKSKNTYLSSAAAKDFNFSVQSGSDNIAFDTADIKISASSNTQGEFAELNSKSSVKSMSLKSNELNLNIDNFNMDLALDSLDKASFQESIELGSQMKGTNDKLLQEKLLAAVSRLMSKGFVFNIVDFSISNITLDNSQALGGFKVQSQTSFQADQDFMKKLQISPLLLIQNMKNLTNIRVSNEIYAKLTKERPLPPQMSAYIKKDGNDYVLDISYFNGELKMNGKTLQ